MKLPIILQNKVIDFLKSLPNIDDIKSRKAFIYSIGLDNQLQELLSFDDPLALFIPLLVSMLIKYGRLKDGRNALYAALEVAKNFVGQEKQAYCETLMKEANEYILKESFISNAGQSKQHHVNFGNILNFLKKIIYNLKMFILKPFYLLAQINIFYRREIVSKRLVQRAIRNVNHPISDEEHKGIVFRLISLPHYIGFILDKRAINKRVLWFEQTAENYSLAIRQIDNLIIESKFSNEVAILAKDTLSQEYMNILKENISLTVANGE